MSSRDEHFARRATEEKSTQATTTVSPSALGEAERDLRSARREPLPKRPRIR